MLRYSHNELEEIRAFMQPVAQSVRVLKSFRNEGESGPNDLDNGQQQQQQQQTPADPFEGIDLDNLPEDAREKIVAAKTQFASLQSDKAADKARVEALDAKARAFQSRADQATALLQKHGLDPNQQQQQQQQQTPAQQLEQQLFKQYTDAGIEEATAKAWAKMQSISGTVFRQNILSEVGSAITPHLANVGVLTVDRMLESASGNQAYSQYLQNPEIVNSVRGYLNTLVTNGSQIDDRTLDTTIKMVVGENAMKNSGQQQHQFQTQTFNGGSRTGISTGFHSAPNLPNSGQRGTPMAANAETASAIDAVTKAMTRGMKVKK